MGDTAITSSSVTKYFRIKNESVKISSVFSCCTFYLGLEVKDMIGDSEIVFKPEGRQQDAVSHREGEAQFLF